MPLASTIRSHEPTKTAYGGWAKGMPKKELVTPLETPKKVPSSSWMVGAPEGMAGAVGDVESGKTEAAAGAMEGMLESVDDPVVGDAPREQIA